VSDTTVPEVAPAAETVEAAKVEVKAATAPYISTTVRNPIVDKASYLEHSVRAKLGNEDLVCMLQQQQTQQTTLA
jgi:translation elongation factor P/translation initiation factor 5A